MCKEKECSTNEQKQQCTLPDCIYLQRNNGKCIIDDKECSHKACELQGVVL